MQYPQRSTAFDQMMAHKSLVEDELDMAMMYALRVGELDYLPTQLYPWSASGRRRCETAR